MDGFVIKTLTMSSSIRRLVLRECTSSKREISQTESNE